MKKIRTTFLLTLTLAAVLAGCSNVNTANKAVESAKPTATATASATTDEENWFTYTKYDIDLTDNIFLGESNAPHTIELAFDYSCPWCKKWMLEVLPQIKEKFINTGEVKYVSQPMSLLNENSLYMAKQDYVIKKKLADKYYDIQVQFASDSAEREKGTWGNEDYIRKTFEKMNLDYTSTFEQNQIEVPDSLTITRKYTKNYAVQGVPTVYVDGIKISDAFSVEEMEKVMNGEVKEGQKVKIEESK